jgi:hypothetical protein
VWGNLREREHLEDVGLDMGIKLKWVSRSGYVGCTGFIWLGTGTNGGLCD